MNGCTALHVLRGAMGRNVNGWRVAPRCTYRTRGGKCIHCHATKVRR